MELKILWSEGSVRVRVPPPAWDTEATPTFIKRRRVVCKMLAQCSTCELGLKIMNRRLFWILGLSLTALMAGCSSQANPSDADMMGSSGASRPAADVGTGGATTPAHPNE